MADTQADTQDTQDTRGPVTAERVDALLDAAGWQRAVLTVTPATGAPRFIFGGYMVGKLPARQGGAVIVSYVHVTRDDALYGPRDLAGIARDRGVSLRCYAGALREAGLAATVDEAEVCVIVR